MRRRRTSAPRPAPGAPIAAERPPAGAGDGPGRGPAGAARLGRTSRRATRSSTSTTRRSGADTVAGPGPRRGRPAGQGHDQGARRDHGRQRRPSAPLDPWLGAALRVAEATRNVVDHRRAPARRDELPQLRRPDPARGVLAADRGRPRPRPTRAGRSGCPSPAATSRSTTSRRPARSPRRPRSAWSACSTTSPTLVGPAFAADARRDPPRRRGRRPGLAGSAYAGARGRGARGRPARARPRARGRAPGLRPRGDRARPRGLGAGRLGRRARGRPRGGRDVGRPRAPTCGCPSPTRRPWTCSARARRAWSSPAGPRFAAALELLARQHGLPVETIGSVGGDRLVIELAGAGATGAAEERGSRDRRRARGPARRPPPRLGARPRPRPRLGGLTDVRRVRGRRCRGASRPRPRRSPTLGLFALQHRGQESAGIAVSDGEQLMLYKDLGMISTVLDERRLPSLRGALAIAHCRYSTTGSTIWENAQPTYRRGPRRALAIGHNGNLVNTRELLDAARGRPCPPAGLDRHGAADRAPRRRARRGHGRGAASRSCRASAARSAS